MALTLSKTGISTSNTIEAWHVTQSVDAFSGLAAYNIYTTGSIIHTGSFNIIGNISQSGDIIPDINNSYNIGSETKRWRGYFNLINSNGPITGSSILATSGFVGNGSGLTNLLASGSSGYIQFKSINGYLTGCPAFIFNYNPSAPSTFYVGDGTNLNNTVYYGDVTVKGAQYASSEYIAAFTGSTIGFSGSVNVAKDISFPLLSGIGSLVAGVATITIDSQLTSTYDFSNNHVVLVTKRTNGTPNAMLTAYTYSTVPLLDGFIAVSSSVNLDSDSFNWFLIINRQ